MILFRKLVIQNFLSYGKRQVIRLANQGIVLIEGINEDSGKADSNMAGKSSIMEAIIWCLFGKLLRGQENADAVVNRRAKKDCLVRLEFSVESVSYRCSRSRRHRRYSNKIRLFRDGKALRYRHEADTQRKLESIIGCDYSSFTNSTVFGGFDGSRKQFAKLSDADQKKVLDSFLKFEKFELALKRTKRILADSRELSRKTQLEVEKQRGTVLSLKERVSTLKSSARIFRETAREDRRKLRRRLRLLKAPKITVTKEQVENQNMVCHEIWGQASELEAKKSQAENTLRKLSAQIKDREDLKGKRCPFCRAVITKRTLEEFLLHVEADRKKVLDRLRILIVKLRRKERRLKHGRRRLKRLQTKHNEEGHQLSITNSAREELRERIKQVGIPSTPFSTEIDTSSIQYSQATSRLLVSEYKNQSLVARIKDLEFWEEGFGNKGVKTLIVREALPAMNKKLAEYASEILDPGAEIEFRPSKQNSKGEERELFYLHYRSTKNSNSYLGESSGGRRRIDICVLLVFSWMARTSNLLLVDELLDGLDETGRQTVLDILSRRGGTVLIITHERGLKSKIENTWIVRKKNGISTVEATR